MAIDWLLDGIQRATRRALKEIDIAITRRRMGKTLCSLPPVSASVDEFVQFFSTLEAPDSASRGYINVHLHRMARTMTIVPPPSTTGRALELGCYMQMTLALSLK